MAIHISCDCGNTEDFNAEFLSQQRENFRYKDVFLVCQKCNTKLHLNPNLAKEIEEYLNKSKKMEKLG